MRWEEPEATPSGPAEEDPHMDTAPAFSPAFLTDEHGSSSHCVSVTPS